MTVCTLGSPALRRGGLSRDAQCLTFARDLTHKVARSGEVCPGKASKLVQVFENSASNGHTLMASEMEGAVLFSCSRCLAYGTALPKKLLGSCEGSRGTSYEKFVAARIRKGIHPKIGINMPHPSPLAWAWAEGGAFFCFLAPAVVQRSRLLLCGFPLIAEGVSCSTCAHYMPVVCLLAYLPRR